MSASVATSAVGLLDRPFTPPDPRGSSASEWQDHMDLDISVRQDTRNPHDDSSSHQTRRETVGAQSGEKRRNVLSGLLAALATNTNDEQPVHPPSQDREHRSVTPPQDSPISNNSPVESSLAQEQSRYPEAIETAVEANQTRLPDAPANEVLLPLDTSTDNLLLDPITTAALENMPIPAFEMPSDPMPQTPISHSPPINIKRQYDAFARLEFDDGIFYLNTYQCELGRDQHAYHMALQREREAQEAVQMAKPKPTSSRGRASQLSNIIKAESQVQGSVVSEAGGFAGVDEQPVEGYASKQNGQPGRSRGSHSSDASIVRPADVLHNPSLAHPFDYNKEASRQFPHSAPPIEEAADEDERPAPVTADHLPDPNSCPLIPIHVTSESETTELDGLKAISRRHMKIFWSWDHSSFMLEVLGRNGAFLEGDFVAPSEVVPLYSGANIQISSVNFVFRLPHIDAPTPSVDSISNMGDPLEPSLTNQSEVSETAQKGKLKLKLKLDESGLQAALPNGESRRRGPGRPPKDGVMSQRERKEREKADKEAKTRALNGESSPPALQRKSSKSQLPKPEQIAEAAKPEKRKYNKRKREDGEEEQVLPSIEAQDETPIVETPQPQPVVKKARTKSYSPQYKPKEECDAADLARPAHNYAVLLYQVLSQTGEISLRQIYKEMQSRWPYFKYVVESDGWTSSVRHNLNQEVGKLFLKGRKEGKGFTWLAKPNAMEEYQAQKNKRSNAPAVPRPRPTAPTRANFAPNQGQQLTWQNSGPAPQSNGMGNPAPHPNQWTSQQNNQNRPGPPIGGQPNGQGPHTNTDVDTPTPPHMLVTFLGIRIIDRFENTMMAQLRQRYATEEEKLQKWHAVFRSARARCLNGSPASSLPEGETDDERTIMTHINNFVNMYRNPAFKGFHTAAQPVNMNAPSTNTPGVPNPSASNAPVLATQTGSGQQSITTQGPSSLQAADSHGHPLPAPMPVSAPTNVQSNVSLSTQNTSGAGQVNDTQTNGTPTPAGVTAIAPPAPQQDSTNLSSAVASMNKPASPSFNVSPLTQSSTELVSASNTISSSVGAVAQPNSTIESIKSAANDPTTSPAQGNSIVATPPQTQPPISGPNSLENTTSVPEASSVVKPETSAATPATDEHAA